jgi:hypothetical protein
MIKTYLKTLLSAVCITAASPFANADQNFTQFTGPGLDYTTWNGALLIGPGHSLWGMRVGYLEGEKLVTGEAITDKVARAGAYAPSRSYAELDLTDYTIRWAKHGPNTMLAEVTAGKDLAFAAEVYPAPQHTGNVEVPWPIHNPAQMQVGPEGIITGTSQHIDTVAGKTRITGGNAEFDNRSVTIAPAEKGLDHLRMETFPQPAEVLDSEACKARGFSHDGRNRSCAIIHAKKGQKVYLAVSVSAGVVAPLKLSEGEIKKAIDAAQAKFLSSRLHGTGKLGLCAEPMINEILWTSTYNPFERQVFVPAGRPWMGDGRYN